MAKTQILEYTIYFDDKAVVDRLNAAIATGVPTAETGTLIQYPGGGKWGIYRAPATAATEFASLVGAVPFGIIDAGEPIPPHDGGYITGEWFTPSNSFDRTVPFFIKDGGWWIFGEDTKFYWIAQVAWAPPAAGATPGDAENEPTEPADIPVRYALVSANAMAVDASYITTPEEQASNTPTMVATRAAGRMEGQYGWGMRNDGASATQNLAYNHQNTPRSRWERFYFRAPAAPNTTTGIWRGQNASVAGTGFGLAITAQLQVALLNFSASQTFALVGTFADLEVNTWYKFDVLFDVDAVGDLITITVFLNGSQIISSTRAAGGVQGSRYHTNSALGETVNNTTSASFHFAEYIIAAVPKSRDLSVAAWDVGTTYSTGQFVRSGGFTYRALQGSTGEVPGQQDPPGSGLYPHWMKLADSVDFQQGSFCAFVPGTAFSPNHGTWTGDVRMLRQKGDGTTKLSLSSTTSGALAAVETDLEKEVESVPGALGWVAAQVTSYNSRGTTANNGKLGYLLGSASVAVDTTITQGTAYAWRGVLYSPTGENEPIGPGETLELRQTKGADTGTGRLASLFAFVEVVGRFGPEDDPVIDPVAAGSSSSGGASSGSSTSPVSNADDRQPNGLHNCHFPRSPWHKDRGALGPIIVKGGTYVGNGTGVTLSLPVPPAFLFIRPSTGIVEATIWYPAILDGHLGHNQGAAWTGITGLEQDDDFVDSDPDADQQMSFDLHIGGSDTALNTNGTTYQYIAFCDPAARYTRSGIIFGNDLRAPFTEEFPDDEFQPELLLAWQELLGTTTTDGLNQQGPASTVGTMQLLTAATTIASAITPAAGHLTIAGAWVNVTFAQYGYLGFRRHDGNDHPDEGKVMFMGTYVGDGSASRTVSIAPTTGFRPLFAFVQGVASASACYRDPTHTTNTSTNFSSASTITTGITAGGIDSFTVGSTLNSNGVTYQYFGFFADAVAGNGGWGSNGTYAPVPADSPFPSDWTEPVEIPFEGASSSGPAGPPPEQPDLDSDTPLPNTTLFCLDYSTRVVNRALGRIGISKQVADLAIDTTEQAVVARLHLKDDVEATLRLFPWQFATAYANLVLHSGDDSNPVNEDWQYAYLAPADMVYARRIAPQSGRRRKYDTDPIVFRTGLDVDDGTLIYCNERASTEVPLQLEYTRRVSCPTYFGDALFREALVWKVASSLAASLAKDANKAEFCLNAFEAFRHKAQVAAANEQQAEKDTTGGDAPWTSGRGDAPWTSGRE